MGESTSKRGEAVVGTPPSTTATGDHVTTEAPPGVVFPRLLIGFIVLVCAEVFSGASVKVGLWNPFTWLLTYWLYFAHFFFFTTLAVRTRRTSLSALYLWGVLFGLYESWITKVIWYGYGGSGKFVMGGIGPYGYSEMSMVFLFHPVASFILPLAVACLLSPSLRSCFPDLAWLTGKSRGALAVRTYLIICLPPVMAMNSGGPAHLALSLAFVLVVLGGLWRLSRSRLAASDGRRILVFGAKGFCGLCLYLILLYGVTYPYMIPEGLPSVPVQLFTFVFYALAIAGLWLHGAREPLHEGDVLVESRERKLVMIGFLLILGIALALSPLAGHRILFLLILPNFFLWIVLGFLLTGAALVQGGREWFARDDRRNSTCSDKSG